MRKPLSIAEDIIGIRDAAAYLGVSTLTLKRWEQRGYIKSIRIGPRKDRRYHKKEIQRIRGELQPQ